MSYIITHEYYFGIMQAKTVFVVENKPSNGLRILVASEPIPFGTTKMRL